MFSLSLKFAKIPVFLSGCFLAFGHTSACDKLWDLGELGLSEGDTLYLLLSICPG